MRRAAASIVMNVETDERTSLASPATEAVPIPSALLAVHCLECGHPHHTTRPTCAECGSARLAATMHCSIPCAAPARVSSSLAYLIALGVGGQVVSLALLNVVAVQNGWRWFIVTELALFVLAVAAAASARLALRLRPQWRRGMIRVGRALAWQLLLPTVCTAFGISAVLLAMDSGLRYWSAAPTLLLLLTVRQAWKIAVEGTYHLRGALVGRIRRRAAWQNAPMRGRLPVSLSDITSIRQSHPWDPRCLEFVARDGWIGDVELRADSATTARIISLLRAIIDAQQLLPPAARAQQWTDQRSPE